MLKNRLLWGIAFFAGVVVACERTNPYDEAAQREIDENTIKDWIAKDTVSFTRHESGVYYKITKPGTGNRTIGLKDTLYVQYEGKLLTDSIFSSTATETDTLKCTLEAVMPGWQKVVPLIKLGGQIRMIIPSTLGYQNKAVSYGSLERQQVPPNSNLDFRVDIRRIKYYVSK